MTQRVFTMQDQAAFAQLSGDHNPLHVDAIRSRRLLIGRPVVHGIHLLLWALDTWLRDHDEPVTLQSLKAYFLQPVGVGEEVAVDIASGPRDTFEILLGHQGSTCTRIVAEPAVGTAARYIPADAIPSVEGPRARLPADIETAAGSLKLFCDAHTMSRMFPHVWRHASALQTSILLGSTRLVGMQCPGLHSLYAELHLEADAAVATTSLVYRVQRFDPRFGLVDIALQAPGTAGRIRAFVRPGAVAQAGTSELAALVSPGEFAAQCALVIGGSRGLGEVAAKLLATGGAQVYVTYARGREDADSVVADIVRYGGAAQSVQLDVLGVADASIWTSLSPTHLYYFASPPILGGRRAEFSQTRFERYCDFYVHGLARLVEAAPDPNSLCILYPSTVFIDEPPADMDEYVAAKTAGEQLCARLQQDHPGLHIHSPRLPRLATDQTAAIIPARREDPALHIVSALRATRCPAAG